MAKAIKMRENIRDKVFEILNDFTKAARSVWGHVTVILVGSYLRGDFNVWSDIDVLVIVEDEDPNPLKRYDKIIPILMRFDIPIEPVIITKKEFFKGLNKKNPLIMEAMKIGKVFADDLHIFKCLNKHS